MSKFQHSALVVLSQSDDLIARTDCALPTLFALDGSALNGRLTVLPSFDGKFSLGALDDEVRNQGSEQFTSAVTREIPVVHGLPLGFVNPLAAMNLVSLTPEVGLNPVEQRAVAVVDVEDEVVADPVSLPFQFNRSLSVDDAGHVAKGREVVNVNHARSIPRSIY